MITAIPVCGSRKARRCPSRTDPQSATGWIRVGILKIGQLNPVERELVVLEHRSPALDQSLFQELVPQAVTGIGFVPWTVNV